MKVTKEKSAEHHEAMIVAGSRLYRERGFDGIGVADVMNAAGLTHGAFYGHFPTKDAFCAQALKHAFEERRADWDDGTSLSSYIDYYLSPAHRDKPATGCPIVTFSAQIRRQKWEVQRQFTKGVLELLNLIADRLPDAGRSQSRKIASMVISAMVGGMILARAMAGDRKLSDQILIDSRAAIKSTFGV